MRIKTRNFGEPIFYRWRTKGEYKQWAQVEGDKEEEKEDLFVQRQDTIS